MRERKNNAEYFKNILDTDFPYSHIHKEKIKNALDKAWECRDFEIKLYWQRATYFWVFLSIIFAGFYYANKFNSMVEYKIFLFSISGFGVVFSLAWVLVNMGSKFWLENYEGHIEKLEYPFHGNLYKTLSLKNTFRFSVSKINTYISFFVLTIWVLIFLYFCVKINVSKFIVPPILLFIMISIIIIDLSKYKKFLLLVEKIKRPLKYIFFIVIILILILLYIFNNNYLEKILFQNLNNLVFIITWFFCEILLFSFSE